jgi:hypothetical protein
MILIAALGASALTGLVGFGLSWLQTRREAKTVRWQSRRSAYSRLLAATAMVVHDADTLHLMMQSRSGIGEGVDVVLHYRKPIEAVDLHELVHPTMTALHEALADVWTVGTPQAVRFANVAADGSAEVMRAATESGQARSELGTRLRGVKWTDEQLASWRAAQHALASARAKFANLVS